MIKQFATIYFLFQISLNAIAQPIVVKCTLEGTYTRDGVRDERFSGVFCRDCRVAIKVTRDGHTLQLEGGGLLGETFWHKRDSALDINGFGGPGDWSINNDEIKARMDKYAYGKKDGYAFLNINRLTGSFHSSRVVKNPIGLGNIEENMSGQCEAAKAAF